MQTKCSHCNDILKVPDEYKGRKIKCPMCKQSFVVTEFITSSDIKKSDDSSKKVSTSTTKTKKCPFCGEEIQSEAAKCRFCGEWLNKKVLKKCRECGKPISSKATKCPNCGVPIKKSSVGSLLTIFFVLLGIGLIVNTCLDSDSTPPAKKTGKTKSPNFDEIRRLMKEYRDLEQELAQLRASANLEIQEGWTWETTLGESYSYIRGKVKNIGDTVINYFEVVALYKDAEGNVLDTGYTNSGETLRPGWSKEFEIMHRVRREYKKVSIYVQNVR